MIKVTLDTNVLISATFWSGDSFKVVKLIDERKIDCFLSREILSEYIRVLESKEIIEKISNKDLIVSRIIESVVRNCTIVDPKERIDVVKEDPDDNKILECAKKGNVDYIITRDKHLFNLEGYEGIVILKPEEFLTKLF